MDNNHFDSNNKKTIAEQLIALPLFQDLNIDIEVMNNIVTSSRELHLLKNELIFRRGERYHKGIYFILSGKVTLVKKDMSTISHIYEYDSIGLTAFFGKNMYENSATAFSDCYIIFLPEIAIYQLMDKYKKFKNRLIKQIKQRFEEFGKIHTNFLFHSNTKQVSKYMKSPLITINASASVLDTIELFNQVKVRMLIVTGRKNSIQGVITKDIILAKLPSMNANSKHKVKQIMDKNPLYLPCELPTDTALGHLSKNQQKYAIVICNDQPVGVISKDALLKAASENVNIYLAYIQDLNTIKELTSYLRNLTSSAQYILSSARISREEVESLSYSHLAILRKVFDITTNSFATNNNFKLSDYDYSYALLGPLARKESDLSPFICTAIILNDDMSDEDVNNFKEYSKAYLKNIILTGYKLNYQAADRYMNSEFIKRKSEWLKDIDDWIASPNSRSNIPFFALNDSILLDGDSDMFKELHTYLCGKLREHPSLFGKLINAVTIKLPISFFSKFILSDIEEHKNKINLFENGINYLSIINKILKIYTGINDTTTAARLRSLARLNLMPKDLIKVTMESYDVIFATLLNEQINQSLKNQPITTFIEPGSLSLVYQEKLLRSFQFLADYINHAKKLIEDL